jgi:hypothetical protein
MESDVSGKSFYDLTVYYISYEAAAKNSPDADAKAHLHQRVLFLAEHTQPGSSAIEIKLTLETALLSRYSVSLTDFPSANITLTTDWAAVMARVADRSLFFNSRIGRTMARMRSASSRFNSQTIDAASWLYQPARPRKAS